MKRVILSFAMLAFAIMLPAQSVTKNIRVSNFTGIDASSFFNVTVIKSDKTALEVTIDKELEKYLIAEVKDNEIVLSLDQNRMPRKIRNNISGKTRVLKATVYMPVLKSIDLSGATSLTSNDTFQVTEFDCDVSGASKINSLSIQGVNGEFDISGASSVSFNATFTDLEFDISGASSVGGNIDAKGVKFDISGASNVKTKGRYGKVSVDCSGASLLKIQGESETAKFDVSGAAKIAADELNTNYAYISTSGASSVTANVLTGLDVELTGASTINYSAPANVNAKIIEMSRGCTLKKR